MLTDTAVAAGRWRDTLARSRLSAPEGGELGMRNAWQQPAFTDYIGSRHHRDLKNAAATAKKPLRRSHVDTSIWKRQT